MGLPELWSARWYAQLCVNISLKITVSYPSGTSSFLATCFPTVPLSSANSYTLAVSTFRWGHWITATVAGASRRLHSCGLWRGAWVLQWTQWEPGRGRGTGRDTHGSFARRGPRKDSSTRVRTVQIIHTDTQLYVERGGYSRYTYSCTDTKLMWQVDY